MKELLRIEQGNLDRWLMDYCLTICEGDVMYIQGISDKSLKCLRDVLSGERKLDSGKLYFDEREVADYDARRAEKLGIYEVSFMRGFIETLSIAENLMPMKPFWHIYRAKAIRRKIREYLRQEQVQLDPADKVWRLTEEEQKKLGILKAKLYGARLVILDLTAERIEGKIAEEILQMIREMNSRGMTFLILSANYTVIAEAATRTQLLYQGRDLKESGRLTDAVRERFLTGTPRKNYQKEADEEERLFAGLYDYEWEISDNIWEYLYCVKKNNPEIWEQYIQIDIPGPGEGFDGSTAVIPGDSKDMLLENLSIGENLTIAAAGRTAYGGVISKRLQKKLEETFYKEIQLEASIHSIKELTNGQKKILSVARFGLAKPKAIFLDSPYSDLNAEEAQQLRAYLKSLAKKGIRILYFSKVWETMTKDCGIIIRTQNAKIAKIDTLYHFFPPPKV